MSMNDHEHFEELSALAAGGLLPEEEMREWLEHSATCSQCMADYRMFVEVHDEEIPLTLKRTSAFPILTVPPVPDGLRERFLARMWEAGARFSDEAAANRKLRWRGMLPAFTLQRVAITAASIIALAALTTGSIRLFHRLAAADVQEALATQEESSAARIQHLSKENSELKSQLEGMSRADEEKTANLSRLQGSVTAYVSLLRTLRAELDAAELEKQSSDDARDKRLASIQAGLEQASQQLARAQNELQQARTAGVQSEATVVALQTRVTELSEQLRAARVIGEREQQLLQADRDIRDIMGARNLHIVDVIDAGGSGKETKAFGRVFYTEGKSLVFYAFDLNESLKYSYQVWAANDSSPGRAASLGLLDKDDRRQRRWTLKVDEPTMLHSINTVFVTMESPGGAEKPKGRKLLYAFLGTDANHPGRLDH
jgi:hypothetical protein